MPNVGMREDLSVLRFRKGGSTRYFTQGLEAGAGDTLALTVNRLYGGPFYVPVTQKFDFVGINVTVLGVAASARLGIYADLGTIAPGALVIDAGVVSMATTGVKLIDLTATPIVLTGGQLYWLALICDVVATIRATSGATNLTCISSISNALDTFWRTSCYIAQAYGALPNPFGAVTLTSGVAPAVFLRKV